MTQEQTAQLTAAFAALPGRLGFYYQDLITGDRYGYRENEPLYAASVIKLPVFLCCLQEIDAGRLTMEEELFCAPADLLPGCGALSAFPNGLFVSIRTLLELMITISDNTATNLLIRRLGMAQLQQQFAALGLQGTRLNRLLFDAEAAGRGIENTVTAREAGMLLEKLWRGELFSPERTEYALSVLKRQQINHKIPGYLNDRYEIAHKTGEDDGISNDVGLIFGQHPFLLCFLGSDTDVALWEPRIREISLRFCQWQEDK